jgi:hypothetical protein
MGSTHRRERPFDRVSVLVIMGTNVPHPGVVALDDTLGPAASLRAAATHGARPAMLRTTSPHARGVRDGAG